ncbi:hypothetical protein HNR71_006345 [Kribbella sandramycini]|uniref:Uncharacterized protein n=1 Tax=Kribbella sandramycini TaxID=60450 RepID=A0A841SFG5_9ACTN|nr:hypothetical protein [Kribbella sandramycini]
MNTYRGDARRLAKVDPWVGGVAGKLIGKYLFRAK